MTLGLTGPGTNAQCPNGMCAVSVGRYASMGLFHGGGSGSNRRGGATTTTTTMTTILSTTLSINNSNVTANATIGPTIAITPATTTTTTTPSTTTTTTTPDLPTVMPVTQVVSVKFYNPNATLDQDSSVRLQADNLVTMDFGLSCDTDCRLAMASQLSAAHNVALGRIGTGSGDMHVRFSPGDGTAAVTYSVWECQANYTQCAPQSRQQALRMQCAWWNFESSAWDQSGCVLSGTNSSDGSSGSTDAGASLGRCVCSHLTNFAILVSLDSPNSTAAAASGMAETVLSVVTILGCSLSIVCLTCVCAVLVVVRNQAVFRIQHVILLQLCVALLAVNVLFVSSIDRGKDTSVAQCQASSVLLHYFLLAVLFWMLCEAMQLRSAFVAVFPSSLSLRQLACRYAAVGWGVPLVIVGIAMAAGGLDRYISSTYCWIDAGTPQIWAFLVPVAAVISVNICIWAEAVVRIGQFRGHTVALKACVYLGMLVGVTWALAFVVMAAKSIVAAYAFTICNAFQGVLLFYFHFHSNQDLKQAFNGVVLSSVGRQKTTRLHAKKDESHLKGEGALVFSGRLLMHVYFCKRCFCHDFLLLDSPFCSCCVSIWKQRTQTR